jgi:N-acetylglucosaminyldiphosphoundecaprenol N-acetyl-beta-D-mannosaminyltransferase
VELVRELCAKSAETGLRLYFLGAAEGVADEAAQNLCSRYPGCQIVGTHHGFFKPDQDAEIARLIGESRPDVLFVAMGIPRQEKFIMATKDIHGAKVAMGVGGSFDVYSGRVKRAPVAFQKLGLEWLWRVILNPSKISKVAALPRFVGMVMRSR